jgi:type III pantothenate kinase
VGADRITDAVAAYRLYGAPVIVVDLGTATVFDAVSREGDYLGGAIAPGIAIALEALIQHTSKLYRVELVGPKQAIGKNTIHAIQSGLMFGYAGLVEALVRRFQEEMGGGAKVVATGGLADVVAKEAQAFDVVNADLTLQGLRFIYELNRSPLASRDAGAGEG